MFVNKAVCAWILAQHNRHHGVPIPTLLPQIIVAIRKGATKGTLTVCLKPNPPAHPPTHPLTCVTR